MKLVEMPVADLVGAKASYNPRSITEHDYEALRRSIERFGVVEPIVYNERTKRIVGGHQRVDALESLKVDAAPVVLVDLSESEERALNLALNRVSGRWEWDALREVVDGLDDEHRLLAGFHEDEYKALADDGHLLNVLAGDVKAELAEINHVEPNEGETSPDAVPDVETFVEPGDLWRLGNHRLLCGDATSADDVADLWDGAVPQLLVTDPPYGVEYDPNWRNEAAEKGQIAYAARRIGEVRNDDRASWLEAWLRFSGDVAYVWHGALRSSEVAEDLMRAGLQVRAQIIWNKPHSPITRGHYRWQHEPCWYAVRKGGKAHWIGDKSASTVWSISLDENVPGGHGTQKPVECMSRPIANHDAPEVYDPFLGSGTTLIACEQYDRACYGMDIDAHYCSVAIRRWEEFTGRKAEKVT